jgi:hypothetical protein
MAKVRFSETWLNSYHISPESHLQKGNLLSQDRENFAHKVVFCMLFPRPYTPCSASEIFPLHFLLE